MLIDVELIVILLHVQQNCHFYFETVRPQNGVFCGCAFSAGKGHNYYDVIESSVAENHGHRRCVRRFFTTTPKNP